MKRLALMSLSAVALLACSDSAPTAPRFGAPNLELVNPADRVAAEDVNAHVYGTFSITFPGSSAGVITSGTANFPGNPKNAGTCDNGLWINPQGKRTSGSLDKPHPHCVGTATGTIQVVLEPISAKHGSPGQSSNEYLQFTLDREDGQVKKVGGGGPNDPDTKGEGILYAYAIDAATIGDASPVRVGILTIDLSQIDAKKENLFEDPCTLGDASGARCLNIVLEADYEPLAINGVGVATSPVTGFLYWTAASSPYNYGPTP